MKNIINKNMNKKTMIISGISGVLLLAILVWGGLKIDKLSTEVRQANDKIATAEETIVKINAENDELKGNLSETELAKLKAEKDARQSNVEKNKAENSLDTLYAYTLFVIDRGDELEDVMFDLDNAYGAYINYLDRKYAFDMADDYQYSVLKVKINNLAIRYGNIISAIKNY